MTLDLLRPSQGASFEELSLLINSQGWKAILPEKLPEHLLLSLARDARVAEFEGMDRRERQAAMACVIYSMVSLLAGDSQRAGEKLKFKLTEDQLMRSLAIYGGGLDTEICSRILGVPSPRTTGFLDFLRAQVQGRR